jgi:hypothetical protein
MARKYITVTLTARVSGDSVVLLDAHGKKIAVIPALSAECTTSGTIEAIEVRHEWRHAFSGMIGSIHNKRSRILRSPWEIKISTWMKSLRLRRNRPKPYYCKNFRYSDEKRKVWSDAVRCLLSQYNNKLHEHRLRAKSPWRLWAQTVAGNHRKKRCVYADSSVQEKTQCCIGDGDTAGAKAEQPDIQLQLQWNRNDSCSVVA